MAETITLEELLTLAFEAKQTNLHVAMPGIVESYDHATQTADVIPQLNKALPDGQGNYIYSQLPKLISVPVSFQRCKQFTMTFPLVAGDSGTLLFSERSIAVWRTVGTPCNAGDVGMHTLDGAMFIPGISPDSMQSKTADSTNMIIGSETDGDSRIEIKPSGGINLGAGATSQVLTQTDFETFLYVWQNAAVGTVDGGALMRTNTIAALGSAGWAIGSTPHVLGSGTVKAKR